ncbi:LysR substrate-binding domain-containing protein [Cupriavidus sp. YAF13]|uniref:LysR family transcriptional regulator n=1 Tax=Cupriavidus sp. YAF13 TaxID=3233075 RepID=UPI003F9196D0
MHYSLIDLKLFVAVADAGNVSRGGATCFLAPSSASLRIKQLEQALGTRLFVREARGVSLTRAGQVMLEHCRRCLAELEQMHANLAPYAEGVRAQVTIFANSSAIASFLPGDLQTFLRDYPEVRISLDERLSHNIVAAVAEGRADVGVVTWDDEHPELVFLPYRQDEVVMVVPEGDPLAARQSVAFLDCLSRPFVSLQSGAAIHTFMVGKAAALGHHMDVRIQVSGFAAVVAMVRSGAGVGMVPRSVLRSINCDGVRVLTLCEKWAVRPLKLCTRRDAAASAVYVSALLRQLGQQADALAG